MLDEHGEEQAHTTQNVLDLQRVEHELTAARAAAVQAQDARNGVESRLAQARARQEILDELFAKLEVSQHATDEGRAASPKTE